MKTVKQFLQEIEDREIRRLAKKYVQIEIAGYRAKSMEHALFMAFRWHMTPEGYNYWSAIHHNYRYPDDQMAIPEPKNSLTTK